MVSQSLILIDSSLTNHSSRSLGSLGYNAKVDLSPTNFGRLLAIISRVYPKLHVRAAAYTLWGLSRMDIVWDDLIIERRSLVNGNNISPLSEGICKYLKARVASMKEHEYSVLLYSLGELKLNWNKNLPVIVKEKVFHRLTRVSSFITSRSLANLLYGKYLQLSISLPLTLTLSFINKDLASVVCFGQTYPTYPSKQYLILSPFLQQIPLQKKEL